MEVPPRLSHAGFRLEAVYMTVQPRRPVNFLSLAAGLVMTLQPMSLFLSTL